MHLTGKVLSRNFREKFRSHFIVHPFVMAIFPILTLHLSNFSQVDFAEVLPFVIASLTAQSLFWFVGNKLIGSERKTALILSVAWFLFFSTGQFFPSIAGFSAKWLGVDFRREIFFHYGFWLKVSASIFLFIFSAVIYLTLRTKSELKIATRFMNASAGGLLVLLVIQYIFTGLKHSEVIREFKNSVAHLDITSDLAIGSGLSALPNDTPDIYYLILDGYGRSDILQEYYRFDNTELLLFLEANGFYLAERSHSNYSVTVLSLASSLNMTYLDGEIGGTARVTSDPYPVFRMIHVNRLFEILSRWGYRIVTFASGYKPTEINSADLFLTPGSSFTQFQNGLINLTPLPLWLLNEQYETHRRRIRFIFNELPGVTIEEQPSFVFAHIPSPHPPFVFGSDGQAVNLDLSFTMDDGDRLTALIGQENYKKAYISQVRYLNQLLMEAVRKILSSAQRPTIIIIQGDHGPGSMLDWDSVDVSNIPERMSILNAYYFFDQNYAALYPEITPVNTFRAILDQYFGTHLGLAEDRSYFTLLNRLYDFTNVSERLIDSER